MRAEQAAALPAIATALDLGRLVRFIAIGVAGALSFVALSSGLIWLGTGVADWVVSIFSYAVLIVPVYLLHRQFSFQSNATHRKALPRYMAVQGMALLLAGVFSYVVHAMMLPVPAGAMLVIVLTSAINFLVLRGWAFAQERRADVVSA